MDDLIGSKSDIMLYRSLLAEAAKSQNELRCAQRDIDKALARVSFSILLINDLINRENQGD